VTIEDLVRSRNPADRWQTATLWAIAREFPDGVFGEIGFRCGGSALAFCLAAREVGGKVYSIDIDPCEEGRERIAREGYADIHTFIQGDSAAVRFPEQLDILYIDGNHFYPDVRLDYRGHYGTVKRGGLILFHDPVSCVGVRRLLLEEKIMFLPFGAGLGMEVVGWDINTPYDPRIGGRGC